MTTLGGGLVTSHTLVTIYTFKLLMTFCMQLPFVVVNKYCCLAHDQLALCRRGGSYADICLIYPPVFAEEESGERRHARGDQGEGGGGHADGRLHAGRHGAEPAPALATQEVV